MQLAYQRPGKQRTEAATVPPIVFLHAFPVDSRMWRGQLSAFEPTADVLALDLRGYGRSAAGDEPFSVGLFADDVLETLSALEPKVGPAIFAGCSMGGYVAFELWRRRPEAVVGLILCDTRAEADTEEIRAKRRDQMEKIRAEGPEFLPRLMTQNVLAPVTKENRPELAAEVRGWMEEPEPGVLIRTLEMLGNRPDSTATLTTITVPTLVIVGEHDSVTPRDCAERMRDGIAGAEMVEIPNAGHLSPLENPAAVNRATAEWLERHHRGPEVA